MLDPLAGFAAIRKIGGFFIRGAHAHHHHLDADLGHVAA
jgi:hypothetical protein